MLQLFHLGRRVIRLKGPPIPYYQNLRFHPLTKPGAVLVVRVLGGRSSEIACFSYHSIADIDSQETSNSFPVESGRNE